MEQKKCTCKYVSRSIYDALKSNGSSKGGQSILQYLPTNYIRDLKQYIQDQFKDYPDKNEKTWMTWENHGIYNRDTYDQNPIWQLDHITPHSEFDYKTMDCQEFRECWTLENLRPYPSKQNQHDGTTRVRHKSKHKKGLK